jgi:hypothetical protein
LDVESLRAAARAGELSTDEGELAPPATEADKWMEAFKAMATGMGVVVDAVVVALDKAYVDIQNRAGRPVEDLEKGEGAAKLVDLISEAVIIGVIDSVENESTRASLKRMVGAVSMGGEDEIVTAVSPRPTPSEVKALADIAVSTGITMDEATRSFTSLLEARKPRLKRPLPALATAPSLVAPMSLDATLEDDSGLVLGRAQTVEMVKALTGLDTVSITFCEHVDKDTVFGELHVKFEGRMLPIDHGDQEDMWRALRQGDSFTLEFALS